MSTIYICEDTENDMDPFLAVDRDGVFQALEDLCGGNVDSIYEDDLGLIEVYWIDNLDEGFTVRCFPQDKIYGDNESLDQLKVA